LTDVPHRFLSYLLGILVIAPYIAGIGEEHCSSEGLLQRPKMRTLSGSSPMREFGLTAIIFFRPIPPAVLRVSSARILGATVAVIPVPLFGSLIYPILASLSK